MRIASEALLLCLCAAAIEASPADPPVVRAQASADRPTPTPTPSPRSTPTPQSSGDAGGSPTASPSPSPSPAFRFLPYLYETPTPPPQIDGPNLRFEDRTEVLALEMNAAIARFFDSRNESGDMMRGATPGGAPTMNEMRNYRPHISPSVDFLGIAMWALKGGVSELMKHRKTRVERNEELLRALLLATATPSPAPDPFAALPLGAPSPSPSPSPTPLS